MGTNALWRRQIRNKEDSLQNREMTALIKDKVDAAPRRGAAVTEDLCGVVFSQSDF